jgi:hypothetical protein
LVAIILENIYFLYLSLLLYYDCILGAVKYIIGTLIYVKTNFLSFVLRSCQNACMIFFSFWIEEMYKNMGVQNYTLYKINFYGKFTRLEFVNF